MTEASRLEQASSKLRTALAGLEEAAARRLEHDRGREAMSIQLDAAQADRARLAEDLDRAMDRLTTLETVNRDVARRLDQAMETVRAILAANGA